jgi:hypothetical protein
MLEGQAVQLDHADDGSGRYLGYSHRHCNASAGASRGNRMRAAAYRAAKGLPPPNGIVSTTVKENPPPAEPECQRLPEAITTAAPAPLACICGRRSSRCW